MVFTNELRLFLEMIRLAPQIIFEADLNLYTEIAFTLF